jgi:hypothetical protein
MTRKHRESMKTATAEDMPINIPAFPERRHSNADGEATDPTSAAVV